MLYKTLKVHKLICSYSASFGSKIVTGTIIPLVAMGFDAVLAW